MEHLRTVKQTAAYLGTSVQSLYKRLQTPQNAKALEGHIIKQHGSTYLDDYAVEYLNANRAAAYAASPAAQNERMLQEVSAKAEDLQKQNDALKERLMDTLERLTAATQAASDSKVELTEVKGRLALLEDKHSTAEERLKVQEEKIRVVDQEAEQLRHQIQKGEEETASLREQLQEETLRRETAEKKEEEERKVREELDAEIQRLKGRGFWDRLFNR